MRILGKYNRKCVVRGISILMVCLFVFNNTLLAYSDTDTFTDTLSPWLSFSDNAKSSELQVAAICSLIEKRVAGWQDKSIEEIYTDDILLWKKSSEPLFDDFSPALSADRSEIIINIPSSNISIRYYDSSSADNTLSPYTDWSRTRTKVINKKVNRQIIYRVPLLPVSAAKESNTRLRYEDLLKDTERLAGVDSFICDFDGVDRVEYVGEGGYVRVAMPESVVVARRELSRRGVLNVTVTANIPRFFEEKFGGIERMASLSVKTPFHVLTRSGAYGQYVDKNGVFHDIPGYEQKTFGKDITAERIFDIASEKLIDIMVEKGIISVDEKASVKIIKTPDKNLFSIYSGDNMIIEGIRYGITPMGVTINVIKDERLHNERFSLARRVKEDPRIRDMIVAGDIPGEAEFVASFSAVDIMPVSKGASVIQMIKNKRLKRVVLMADSAGTEEKPGNDRSMLTLAKDDLIRYGIDWDVDIIKVYVGNELNAELPDDVYILPSNRKGLAPSIDMYNAVAAAKDEKSRKEKENRYVKLLNSAEGMEKLEDIEAIFSDFDGVDRVTVVGSADGVKRKTLPDEVVNAKRAIAEKGVLNVTMTGTTLEGLISKSGNFKKIESQSSGEAYYYMLLCSGAEGMFVDENGEIKDIPGYRDISFQSSGLPERIFDVIADNLLDILKKSTMYRTEDERKNLRIVRSGDSEFIWIYSGDKKISKPVRIRVLPQSVSIGMVDDPDIYPYKDHLLQRVKNDTRIKNMVAKGELPVTSEFVSSFSAVDVVPVSKGESLLQIIKMKRLSSIVIMADSAGTDHSPGNDRSMLTLDKEDLIRYGIDWDVNIIKIYAGREKDADIPDDVYIVPENARGKAPGLGLYEAVLEAKGMEEKKSSLREKARDLSDDIENGSINKIASLREEYIIESPFNRGSNVNVYGYPGGEEKIAYIDSDNWGNAVLLPEDSGISIYTDLAGPCVPLIMRLVDNGTGRHYILMAHLLAGKVGRETENIIVKLKERGLHPESIILNPEKKSVYQWAENILRMFLDDSQAAGKDPDITMVMDVKRSSFQASGARAFADRKGWALFTPGNPPGVSDVWIGSGNFRLPSVEDILVYPAEGELGCFSPVNMSKGPYNESDKIYFSGFGKKVFFVEKDFIHPFLRVFNTETGELLKTFDRPYADAGISQDGKNILIVDNMMGTVEICDIYSDRKKRFVLPEIAEEWDVTLSLDNSTLLARWKNSMKAYILDASNGRMLGHITMDKPVTSMSMSPDNNMILVSSEDEESFFDIKGDKIRSFSRKGMVAEYSAFSPDGSRYLTATGQKIIIRDTLTGEKTGYVLNNGEPIKNAVFASEDGRIIVADDKGVIRKLPIIPSYEDSETFESSAFPPTQAYIEKKTRDTTEMISRKSIVREGHINESYILRPGSDRNRNSIGVYNYEKAALPGKVAYIDDDNWGTGVLLPEDIDTGIFTDSAGPCIPVIMRLKDKSGGSYIFLAHIKKEEEKKEVENIIGVLTGYGFVPEHIVIYPAEEGAVSSVSRSLFQRFLDDTNKDGMEKKVEVHMDLSRIASKEKGARAYVDKNGWGIYNPLEDYGLFHLWNDNEDDKGISGADNEHYRDSSDLELEAYLKKSNLFYPVLSDRMKETVRKRIKNLKAAVIRSPSGEELPLIDFINKAIEEYSADYKIEAVMIFGSYLFSGKAKDIDLGIFLKKNGTGYWYNRLSMEASLVGKLLRHSLVMGDGLEMPASVLSLKLGSKYGVSENNRNEYLGKVSLYSPVVIYGDEIFPGTIENVTFREIIGSKIEMLLEEGSDFLARGARTLDMHLYEKAVYRLLHASLLLNKIKGVPADSDVAGNVYSLIDTYSREDMPPGEKLDEALEDLTILYKTQNYKSIALPYLLSVIYSNAVQADSAKFARIMDTLGDLALSAGIDDTRFRQYGDTADPGDLKDAVGHMLKEVDVVTGKGKKNIAEFNEVRGKMEGTPAENYVKENNILISTLLTHSSHDILFRVPVEVIESASYGNRGNVIGFLNALQAAPNGYVELYYATGMRPLSGSEKAALHEKYGLKNKIPGDGFKSTAENTISLFALLKGQEFEISEDPREAKRDIKRLLTTNIGHIGPENTQIVPVGLLNDPVGLLRSTIIGLELIHIARHKREYGGIDGVFEDTFIINCLEAYRGLSHYMGTDASSWSSQDMIDLATGGINTRLAALKKLINLLPVEPIDVEELRSLYEYATETLVAA